MLSTIEQTDIETARVVWNRTPAGLMETLLAGLMSLPPRGTIQVLTLPDGTEVEHVAECDRRRYESDLAAAREVVARLAVTKLAAMVLSFAGPGPVPMPRLYEATEADLREAAAWVLVRAWWKRV